MDSKKILQDLEALAAENEFLKESYASMAQAIIAFDDAGWSPINEQLQQSGFNLQELKASAATIREITEGNPLLKRGCAMRTSYVFGRGVTFGSQPPRIKRLIDDARNQDVIFSPEAQAINERSHFTDGQFFVLGDTRTRLFQRVPFSEITGVVTDPDDPESVRYFRRTWNRIEQQLATGSVNSVEQNVWYPADTYSPSGRYATQIQGQRVDATKMMFASRVNRRAGRIWGVPDALPALPWAHAYNEYLKDGSRLLKSLAMFAWQVKSRTKSGAQAAAATIVNPATAGSTAIMGEGMEMASLPRSASVDLGTGRPLAAMVASGLEISVVALLSDPGASGAYGTAQTLDAPTVKAMESRQAIWIGFYRRVLEFLGAREIDINFPKIETEPSQRMMQALALARETGAIWDDEYRAAVIETLDVPKMHDGPPSDEMDMDTDSSPIPSQGNSGAVGSMQDNANDLRDADRGAVA